MAKETDFSHGTIVTDDFLDSQQEVLTGIMSGFKLSPGTASSQLKLEPTIPISGAAFRGQLTAINDTGSMTAYSTGTRESTAYAAGAASVSVWAKTSAAIQSGTAGEYQLVVSAARPSDFVRKVGEATASAGNVLSNIRLTNGIYADADQYNNFTFRSVLNSAGEIPLTLRGQSAQNTSGATLLSVGFDTAGVYGEKWSVDALGAIRSTQATAAGVSYNGRVTGLTYPVLQLSDKVAFNDGTLVNPDVVLSRSAAATLKVTDTLDVTGLKNTGTTPTGFSGGGLSGAVNVDDDLNLATGKKYRIAGAQISSADLSDVASLATQTYVKEGYAKTTTISTAAPFAVSSTDNVVFITNAWSGNAVVDLPTSPADKVIVIVDALGNCSATNTLTLDGFSTQNINGAPTYVMMSPYESVTLMSLGAAAGWVVI